MKTGSPKPPSGTCFFLGTSVRGKIATPSGPEFRGPVLTSFRAVPSRKLRVFLRKTQFSAHFSRKLAFFRENCKRAAMRHTHFAHAVQSLPHFPREAHVRLTAHEKSVRSTRKLRFSLFYTENRHHFLFDSCHNFSQQRLIYTLARYGPVPGLQTAFCASLRSAGGFGEKHPENGKKQPFSGCRPKPPKPTPLLYIDFC